MLEPSQTSRMDRFLFSPLNAKSVAWFRLALAIVIPWFFWSQGYQPKAIVPEFLHPTYDHVFISKGHFLALVCLCGGLFVGWKPRLCLILIFIMVFPLAFLNSGHVSRPVFLFVIAAFAFVPSGTVRFPWQASEGSQEGGPCWPIRFIQIVLTVLYGVNALAKSSPFYLSGDALIDMSITRTNFLIDMSSGYFSLAMLTLPVGLAAVLSTLSEYLLAIGLWSKRWRFMVAAFGVVFHGVLYFVVDIHMLHFASLFLYLAFLLPLVNSKNGCEKNPV